MGRASRLHLKRKAFEANRGAEQETALWRLGLVDVPQVVAQQEALEPGPLRLPYVQCKRLLRHGLWKHQRAPTTKECHVEIYPVMVR